MMKYLSNYIMLTPLFLNLMMLIILSLPSKLTDYHPLLYLFFLIMLILFTSLSINMMFKSWISFILFLIMIGGLMVIFLYITSLTINNNLMLMDYKSIMFNMSKILLILIIMYLYLINLNYLYLNIDLNNNLINFNNLMSINNLYKLSTFKSTIFLMIYLYYTMICIINICLISKSPLRQIKY